MGPNYRKGKRSVKVSVSTVIDIVIALRELGHLDQFRDTAVQQNLSVSVAPDAINVVKKYLYDNALHDKNPLAQKDVMSEAAASDPFTCQPH